MTVAELITQLKELRPEAIVMLAADAEGNRFSPAADDVSIGVGFDDAALKIADWQRQLIQQRGTIILWPQ